MRYFFPSAIDEWGFLGYLLNGKSGAAFIALLVAGYLFSALIAYFLGSINSAVIISKKIFGYDVRDYGSGNAGMTNMFRTFGKKAGFLTLAGDVVKALIAVSVGFLVLGVSGQYMAGFCCILGHVFPIYFKFKGGKGVIVGAITVLLIDPIVFLVLIGIFGLMFFASQIISASSITAAFFYPLVVYAFNGPGIHIFFALFMGLFIIAMHKDNIHRMINRTEKKFVIKKDK